MSDMIEHGVGIKAMAAVIFKPLLAGLIALGWWPATDYILIQVNESVLLSPETRIILDELKMILGVVISFAVLLKIIIGVGQLTSKK